jgi:hypothetical protein
MRAPSPFLINNGVPPTDLKALTGELTPPGKNFLEAVNKDSETALLIGLVVVISCIYL